jgi:hypothetical protein
MHCRCFVVSDVSKEPSASVLKGWRFITSNPVTQHHMPEELNPRRNCCADLAPRTYATVAWDIFFMKFGGMFPIFQSRTFDWYECENWSLERITKELGRKWGWGLHNQCLFKCVRTVLFKGWYAYPCWYADGRLGLLLNCFKFVEV